MKQLLCNGGRQSWNIDRGHGKPTEVALKNDGCNGHDWDWVTRYQKENGFPKRWSLKEVIDKGKKAIGWDEKWHPPETKKLADGRMHGLGFIHVNEWHWHAPIPGISFVCVTLHHGKAAIIAVRSDMGIDTESGARLAVASEVGLRYEDTVIQERRSDNSNFHFWQPGGSFGTGYITTQLILAARELKKKSWDTPPTGRMESAKISVPACRGSRSLQFTMRPANGFWIIPPPRIEC